jgi:hypothetical protein
MRGIGFDLDTGPGAKAYDKVPSRFRLKRAQQPPELFKKLRARGTAGAPSTASFAGSRSPIRHQWV